MHTRAFVNKLLSANSKNLIASPLQQYLISNRAEVWEENTHLETKTGGASCWISLDSEDGLLLISGIEVLELSWLGDFLSPTEEELFLLNEQAEGYTQLVDSIHAGEVRLY